MLHLSQQSPLQLAPQSEQQLQPTAFIMAHFWQFSHVQEQPAAFAILEHFWQQSPPHSAPQSSQHAALCTLEGSVVCPDSGASTVEFAVVLYFPTPSSSAGLVYVASFCMAIVPVGSGSVELE
jgi:hypothetical protein